jgi:hypothetical protein
MVRQRRGLDERLQALLKLVRLGQDLGERHRPFRTSTMRVLPGSDIGSVSAPVSRDSMT